MAAKGEKATLLWNGEAMQNASPQKSKRDLTRGVWELARLHTREAWLCWYPAVWGACLSAGAREIALDRATFCKVLFGIWSSVTATHATFCTFNDLCDRNLDAHVERCKVRPLPAGMITFKEAVVAFVAWLPLTYGITYATLGRVGVITFLPIWALSMVYPFMKRIIPFPQIVLGAVIGGAVFPGWAAITNDLTDLDQALPLFAATMSWVVYFDVFYAIQDRSDDEKVGVKSLAVLLGDSAWIFLAFLGLLQVGFFALTALKAHVSAFFWIFGLGVWAVNVPWHVLSLDVKNRNSGGKIFKANIMLGLYMTGVALIELLVTRIYPRTLPQVGEFVMRVMSAKEGLYYVEE
ncbi:hypothetical protein DV737_g4177, partial [Chaetothyriales sp. CBS 132003]